MTRIETELDPLVGVPFKIPTLQPFSIDGVDDAEIPRQDVDPQIGFLFTKLIEKGDKGHAGFAAISLADQCDVTVELPARE